jgi:hypothetical protein
MTEDRDLHHALEQRAEQQQADHRLDQRSARRRAFPSPVSRGGMACWSHWALATPTRLSTACRCATPVGVPELATTLGVADRWRPPTWNCVQQLVAEGAQIRLSWQLPMRLTVIDGAVGSYPPRAEGPAATL